MENELDIKLSYKKLSPRESDQMVFIADIGSISKLLDWKPIISKEKGLRMMLDWLAKGEKT